MKLSSQSQQFSKVAFLQLQSSLLSSNKSSQQKHKKAITKLNLFGKGITFIKQLSQQQAQSLKCIKQIDLSHNALTSIQNIKSLPIQILNISHNKFIQQQQFVKIFVRQKNNQITKNLTKIILKGNPFIKKPLSSQSRRWLLGIDNDLQLYSRQQQEYLQLLVQRHVEKLTLQSMFNKVEMNLQFIKVYNIKMGIEEYQRLILLKPQDYFKLLRRQMQWKLQQQQPFSKIKKYIVNQLPIQLFNINNNRRQHSSHKSIATNLVLQLKKRNEILIKVNKQLMTKIQNVVFNYLTQRKMLVEKKVGLVEIKGGLLKVQGIKTSMKNLKNSKIVVEVPEQQYAPNIVIKKQQQTQQQQQQYPQISTPIYIKKPAQQSLTTPILTRTQQSSSTLRINTQQQKQQQLSSIQQHRNPIQSKYGYNLRFSESSRYPFQEIISQVDGEDLREFILGSQKGERQRQRERGCFKEKAIKTEESQIVKQKENYVYQFQEKQVLRQKNIKENIIKIDTNMPFVTPAIKKPQVNKATSKTLFQLSQSLLQKPVMPSDQSVHFDLEQGLAQSQIQKMFFTILTKINPIYHLLYSPLTSLKPTQKSQLIQNLLQLLKQKMKYVQKLQRFKVMYETEKQKSEQLMNVGKRTQEGRDVMMEKNQQLTKEIKSIQKQFQKLSSQLQLKAQQNFNLREQNEKLHFERSKFNQVSLQRQEQQQIEEKIIQMRQKRLKKTYMNDICLRAQKFFRYKQRMIEMNEQKNHILLMGYFTEWKQQVVGQKMYRNLRQGIMAKSVNSFVCTMRSSIDLNRQEKKRTSLLISALKQIRLKSFIKKLTQNKLSISNHKKSLQHYHKKIKRSLFQILKQNRQCQKQQKQNEIVLEFKKQSLQRLKKLVFNQWLIWQRGLVHKQIEVKVNHQGVLACNVVEKLCNFYSYQKTFQAKSLALELYLRDIRKINSFHKLLHEMSLYLQAWRLKLFKINMFTKRAYFDNFLSGIRRVKNKRRIKQKDEQKLRKKMLFDEMKQTKLKRSIKLEKFRRILKEGISQCIKNTMQEFKKQIVTEKMYKRIKCESFFDRFREIHRQKTMFRFKQKQLSYVSKRYMNLLRQKPQFTTKSFFIFMRSSLRFKHSLVQFFIRKNKLLMQRTFYQFRVSCLQQKSQFFQQKLKQLGPDIQLIQQRQIQTNIEKISLTRQIELKNQQIQQYQKQVSQLRLLLQAKQIKYQKLKDIYAQSIEINSRGRDIYQQIEKSLAISPQIGDVYDTGYMNIVDDSKTSSLKQSQTKYMVKTIRQQDSVKKPKVYNYTKYSPQRDVKMTQRRRQINGLQTKKKQINIQDSKSILSSSNNKQKISDFYPSFRRF